MAKTRKLTEKQKRFADEYLIDMNATQAAARAGYKDPNIGRQLITKNNVSEYIQHRREKLQNKLDITQDRVLLEYARLAFFDPRKLFNDDGSPRDVTALDDDTAAALAGLDVQEVYEGTGESKVFDGYVKKYKLANKLGALDSLGKHLGLFDGKGGQDGKQENNLLEAIVESAEEDMDTDDLPEIQ